jgi:predicted permease
MLKWTMNKHRIQFFVVSFVTVLLAISALGYVFAPTAMLSVVGIVGTPREIFLTRTLAAALLALVPSAWSVRMRGHSMLEQSGLLGLAAYMFFSSAVDLHAFLGGLVNGASVPSIVFRVLLGAVLVWLIPRAPRTS